MDTGDWKSVIAALPENNRFEPSDNNDPEEPHTLRLSAELKPSTTGSFLGMSDAVDAVVCIINDGTEQINIKEVGLQADGEDIPFRFEANGTGDNIPDQLLAKDSSQFSRILSRKNTLQKIRDHDELNVYVIDGTRRRTSAKVIVDPSLTQSTDGTEWAKMGAGSSRKIGQWEVAVWPENHGTQWKWKAHLPDWNNHQGATFTGVEPSEESARQAAEEKAKRTLLG